MLSISSSKIYAATSLEDLLKAIEDGPGSSGDPVSGIISVLVNFALPLGGLCVFVLIAMASYKLMTSRGDPDKLRDAKEQITNAVIGFVFILLSVVILVLIGGILKINIGTGY